MESKEERKQARLLEERLEKMVWMLARAYSDPSRPTIRTQGLDERDLAFEAGLLSPAEVEMTIYATQKRGPVLRLLREMQNRGWIRFEPTPPQGTYHAFLLPAGAEHVNQLARPWWSKLRDRVKGKFLDTADSH